MLPLWLPVEPAAEEPAVVPVRELPMPPVVPDAAVPAPVEPGEDHPVDALLAATFVSAVLLPLPEVP